MITLKNVSKKFKNREAISQASISFDKHIYGLLGANGAGKTTLVRCILGLYQVSDGEILFNGTNIKNNDLLNRTVGYLPQKFGLFKELNVYDMLSYFATIKNIPKNMYKHSIEECIEKVNLSDRLYERIGKLSGGMLRRVGIAQALLGNPNVLIFDEPTAGLDPEERMRFKSLLAKLNKDQTVIISTHIVEDIEATCDKIVIMNEGKILTTSTCEEVCCFANGKVFEVLMENEKNLTGNYFIEKTVIKDNKTYLRVLSNCVQDGVIVSETVEDGYMSKIKNI